jgi:hypothetical protein
MCASQDVTRRIGDLVQSDHVNHSIPNRPHVHPLTPPGLALEHMCIQIPPRVSSLLLITSSQFPVPFRKSDGSMWYVPGAGNFLVSKTHCHLSDGSSSGSETQNIFGKPAAIVPMLGLALGLGHFEKSYSPILMFLLFSLKKTVHVFRMLCWRCRLCSFQKRAT